MKKTIKCPNCKVETKLTIDRVKEKTYDGVKATYTECMACGYLTLRQLDNQKTEELLDTITKLTVKQRTGKLDKKGKTRLKDLSKRLIIHRKKLNKDYWEIISQQLNEDADQEA